MKFRLCAAAVLAAMLTSGCGLDLRSRVAAFMDPYGRSKAPTRGDTHVEKPLAFAAASWPAASGPLRRLLPDGDSDASATADGSAIEIGLAGIGRDQRRALRAPLPHAFRSTLALPAGEVELSLALEHTGSAVLDDAVDFEIALEVVGSDAPARTLLRTQRPSYAQGWTEHRVDLSDWAGRAVRLHFRARRASPADAGAAGSSAGAGEVFAYWGNVLVRDLDAKRALPNVALILLDTLRADRLGSYGYERPTSPFLDSLAARGTRFARTYSTAPWTDPSILSLFTSLYPSDVWEPGNHRHFSAQVVPDAVDSFPEQFVAAGYETAALVDHPGITGSRFGKGFDRFLLMNDWRAEVYTTSPGAVLEALHRQLASMETGGNFIYLHLMYPHTPYAAPAAYHELFGPIDREPVEAKRRELENFYDVQVRLTDDVVAAAVRLIEARASSEQTIVGVTADHGEAFWDHGHWEHGNALYNELLHIPFLLYAPGRVPAGRVVDEVVQIIDVAPTLVALAGGQPSTRHRGRSLVGLLRGEAAPRDHAYSEYAYKRVTRGYALQTRDGKLVVEDPDAAGALFGFDLRSDPAERDADALDGDARGALQDRSDALRSSTAERRASLGEAREAVVDDTTADQLRALGYVDE